MAGDKAICCNADRLFRGVDKIARQFRDARRVSGILSKPTLRMGAQKDESSCSVAQRYRLYRLDDTGLRPLPYRKNPEIVRLGDDSDELIV